MKLWPFKRTRVSAPNVVTAEQEPLLIKNSESRMRLALALVDAVETETHLDNSLIELHRRHLALLGRSH